MSTAEPSAPSLKRVARGELCSGCGGCAAVAPGKIAMGYSARGFLRPEQTAPLTKDEDASIAAICPGLVMEQRAEGRRDHLLWGPIVATRIGHSMDPALRRHASSGGALSALLIHMLETKAVDFVLQISAAPELPFANRTVISRSAKEVASAAGSRYAPSAPLAEIAPLLESGERGAFVGKPCDVAALRAMARRDPRIDAAFPYMVSFFCGGVPSLDGARGVLKALGVEERDLAAFRYRGDGWPGFAAATRQDGSVERMSYAASWGDILSRTVQFRCKICPDGTGGMADVVCADAWECDERGYPLFEEAEGQSLIVARTGKGEALVAAALGGGALTGETVSDEVIAAMQPGQLKRKHLALSRILASTLLGRPRPRFSGFNLGKAALKGGAFANLRSFMGTAKRILRGRA